MRTNLQIAICGLFAAITVAQSASAQLALQTKLRFGRHTNVSGPPTQAQQDSIMSAAASALLFDSGTDDVVCNLTPQRLGYSNVFYNGTDIINTSAQFQAVRDGVSIFVNIVNAINFCGATGSFIGCATTNSSKPVVVAKNAMFVPEAGLVVAHEFGHTQGLSHDTAATAQIMEFPIFPDSNRVKSSTVCNTFREPYTATCPPDVNSTLPGVCSPSTTAFAPVVTSGAADERHELITDDESESDFSDIRIEDLALTLIVDRVPVEVELYYNQEAVRVLEVMLRDQRNSLYQRTIVTLIGLISDGAAEDVELIQQYAAQKDADFSASMMALGYIANRTGSQAALDILRVTFEDPDKRTSEAAVLGLILSGDSEAAQLLSERAAAETDAVYLDRLKEALSENRRIAELGLREHYRNPLPEKPVDPSLLERNVPEPEIDLSAIE